VQEKKSMEENFSVENMNKYIPKKTIKCPLCNNNIESDSQICEYCGGIIAYDDKTHRFYVSAIICSKCGLENERGVSRCRACKNIFSAVCPRCNSETQLEGRYCKRCGLHIDQFYIEEEARRQLRKTEIVRSNKIGFYFVGVLYLLCALFFLILAADSGRAGISIKTAAFTLGVIIFFILIIIIGKELFKMDGGKR